MSSSRRFLLGAVASLALSVCSTGAVLAAADGANVIQVPGNYATIQEAVDNAVPGNEILVRGAHDELVVIGTPGIRLRAVEGATLLGALAVFADNVSINGFRVTTKYHQQGIQGNSATGVEIKNNTIISDGDAQDFRGIWLLDCRNCSVENNTVMPHAFTGIGAKGDLTGTEIKNNKITGSPIGIGVFGGTTGAAITNNAIAGYSYCGIVDDSGGVGITLKNNRTGCILP